MVDGDTKAKITLMPTITAGGDKLNLAWINKAETAYAFQKHLNMPKTLYGYFSPSGWNNHEIMCQYLREIVIPYTRKRKAALLLDSYEAHFHKDVTDLAKKNNIKLVRVPEGTTSVCQPLDVDFNSQFKRIRSNLWNKERSGGILMTDNVERTAMRAAKAHDQIEAKIVSRAWAHTFPNLSTQIMHRHRPRRDGG